MVEGTTWGGEKEGGREYRAWSGEGKKVGDDFLTVAKHFTRTVRDRTRTLFVQTLRCSSLKVGRIMEGLMLLVTPAPTHDLIRLREPSALKVESPVPAWVESALRRAPWVVVRRGLVRDGMVPVGVRGLTRAQRFAVFFAVAEIADRLSPEDLTDARYVIEQERKNAVPALAALARVAPILARDDYHWGPGGSVGFEIATGVATATASSDLDLILRQERQLELNEATNLLADLAQAAAPARIDVMLETPVGGVSLADLAATPPQVLVRTPCGSRFSVNPWKLDATALLEVAS